MTHHPSARPKRPVPQRLRHLADCIRLARDNPPIAQLGAREFLRTGGTTAQEADDEMVEAAMVLSYDAGRELAHICTFRVFDHNR